MKTLVMMLLLAGAAHADIVVVLDQTFLAGNPGDTLQFFATITNTSDTDTVYFNGITGTPVSPFFTIDTSPFLLSGPASLAPDQVVTSVEVFDVMIDPAADPGTYPGNSISILGGGASDYLDLVDLTFDVGVNGVTAAPEPASGWLLATGMAAVIWAARRRHMQKRD